MNYFVGDPEQWRSNVPIYGSVRWQGMYEGVNMWVEETASGLGLQVDAAADFAWPRLRLRVEGAEQLRVDARGRLLAETVIGPVALPGLRTTDGVPLRPTVAGDQVSFALSEPPVSISQPIEPERGRSDERRPHAPAVATNVPWRTFLGGAGSALAANADPALGLAVDSDGNSYITGRTFSSNFDLGPGGYEMDYSGNGDVFVVKLNNTGTQLVYGTFLGGSAEDLGYDIEVDGNNPPNAYLTGATRSNDMFPLGTTGYDTSYNGGNGDAFVVKLNSTGSQMVYGTYLGGSGQDQTFYKEANQLAVDGSGNAYITGQTKSDDFPLTAGAYDGQYNGGIDVFVSKLGPAGTSLLYSTYLGGSQDDYGMAITGAADGNIYVTGFTYSANFPTQANADGALYDNTCSHCPESADLFLSKFTTATGALAYSTFLGGTSSGANNDTRGIALAVRSDGTDYLVYVAGETYDPTFPATSGAYQPTCGRPPPAAQSGDLQQPSLGHDPQHPESGGHPGQCPVAVQHLRGWGQPRRCQVDLDQQCQAGGHRRLGLVEQLPDGRPSTG